MYVYCIEGLTHVQNNSKYACRGCYLIALFMLCSVVVVEFLKSVLCVVCDVRKNALLQMFINY